MVICLQIPITFKQVQSFFSLLLNVHSVSDVMQIYITEPSSTCPSPLEDETAIAALKNHKLPGSYKIMAELIQVGGRTLLPVIHTFISIWNKEELPDR
jgi:hypothetical protein